MIEILSTTEASSRLDEAGFHNRELADIGVPLLQTAPAPDGTAVRFRIWGDRNVQNLVFSSKEYSVDLDYKAGEVHSGAKQLVLGPNYCLIELEVYDPVHAPLDHEARKAIHDGSFKPLAERFLAVIKKVDPEPDQDITITGFSMAADVGVETVHENLSNPSYGDYEILRLGAFDLARSRNRGRVALTRAVSTARAFITSGPKQFDNVLASNSPAVLQALGIDRSKRAAKFRHDIRTGANVVRYSWSDRLGTLAFMDGFGHDTSITQLNDIGHYADRPDVVVGRGEDSKMFTAESMEQFTWHDRLRRIQYASDHSAADLLQADCAMILCAAQA